MTRRWVLAGSGAAGASALLAACGTASGGAGSGQTASGGALSTGPAALSFLGRGSAANQQMFQDLSAAFTKANPGITVQYTHEPGNFDQKWTVLASSGQLPDIGFGTVAFFKGQIASGAATTVDELAKRDKSFKEQDYDPYWLAALKYKGKLGGMPWDPGMVVLYYNKNLLQKAGVKFPDATNPLIWDDVVDMAKRLTNTGGPTNVWGLDLWWARFWWHIPRQMGLTDVYQGDENVLKLNDPVAIDALQWLADLRVKYKVARPTNDSGPAADFAAGNLAMSVQGTWNSATYRSKLQDDWDVAPMPQFKGKKRVAMGQASPFIMSPSTKYKDQAWLLMRYLGGPEGQTVSMENGNSQPMIKSQFTSPAYTKLTPPHSPQVPLNETQYGIPSPYGPAYNDLQMLVDKVTGPMYAGQQTAKEAITAAWPSFQQAMADAKARYP